MRRVVLAGVLATTGLLLVSACSVDMPSVDKIRDSRLLDRRINETPRQKVIRECRQETERFRVTCLTCHTTDKIEAIQPPQQAMLTPTGERARIMRTSPSFGLNQNCATCHQTKFKLNRNAEKLFGPGGSRHGEAQRELRSQ